MKFRELWLRMGTDERQEMARAVGTTYKYLQKLSGGFGTPSLVFAARMIEHYPVLTFEGFLDPHDEAPTAPREKIWPKGKGPPKSPSTPKVRAKT